MKKFILAAACIFTLGTSLSAQSPAKTDSVRRKLQPNAAQARASSVTAKQVQPARHPKELRYAKHTTLQYKTRQSPAAKLKASTRRTAKNLAVSAKI